MNLFRIVALAVAFLTAVQPAAAQWQVPNHSVPLGRGAGATGFGSAAPGTAGQVLVSGGPAADPSFKTASSWFDDVYCSTVGYIIVRVSGSWTCSNAVARNVVWFGADPLNVNDSSPAFNAAYATLGTSGGKLYIPAGRYRMLSNVTFNYPNVPYALHVQGDGTQNTLLSWPNANGGFAVNAPAGRSTFHFRDMTLETTQAGSGIAIQVNGQEPNGLNGFFSSSSDITNVDIGGGDSSIGIGTQWWGVGIDINTWSTIAITNVNTYGRHGNPGDAGGGTGLRIAGSAVDKYSVLVNVIASSFNSHVVGVSLGSYWQGVSFNQCNFNGRVGSSAIQSPAVFAGVQVLLTIANSQIDYGNGTQLDFEGSLTDVILIGNSISVYGNNGVGVGMTNGGRLKAIGNTFGSFGGFTGTFGIVYGGAAGIIQGNIFSDVTTPVNLTIPSSGTAVNLNRYINGAGANINNGTGNSLGVITQ